MTNVPPPGSHHDYHDELSVGDFLVILGYSLALTATLAGDPGWGLALAAGSSALWWHLKKRT